jgi:hypothetical protein
MITPETLLIMVVALPFVGSCLAILFRANARNAEAYLTGFISLLALVLVIAIYPRVTAGGIVRYEAPWTPHVDVTDGNIGALAGKASYAWIGELSPPAPTQAADPAELESPHSP